MKTQNRRKFLRNTSIGILGFGLSGKKGFTIPLSNEDKESSKVIGYRRLGRTGAMVSDIGSGDPYNESVLRATLEAGVNFIETSEGYGNGRSEELIGRVIKNLTGRNYLSPPRQALYIEFTDQ